jgi:hypothetical protein
MLVTTNEWIQYRNALEEWSTGYLSTVKLDSKDYGPVYNEILDAMAAIKEDEVDGPPFQERLAAWAGFGM